MNDYAVFDLETTGFSPRTDAITEIGWIVIRDGVVGEPYSLLIQPSVPVPDDVAALTGITTELLEREGVPLAEALLTFLRDTEGLPLVGHNCLRFDCRFLDAACARIGGCFPTKRYTDTAALYKARKLGLRPRSDEQAAAFAFSVLNLRVPGLKYSLAHCCAELGIRTDDVREHRAAADATLTQRLYAALTAPAVVTGRRYE